MESRPLLEETHLVPLTWKERIAVNLGVICIAAFESLRSAYSSPFFLDVVGMSGTDYGNIFLVSRLFDAITDPLMGYLTDSTNSRWGRRKPWIIVFLLPFALSYFLLWVTFTSNIYYFLVVFLLFEAFSTIVTVPYVALLTEMSTSYDDATSINSYRFFITFMSIAIVFALHGSILSITGDDEKKGYMISGLTLSVILIPTMGISLHYCKEKGELRAESESENRSAVGYVSTNDATADEASTNRRHSIPKGVAVIEPISDESKKETEKITLHESFWTNIKHVMRVRNYWIVCFVYLAYTIAGGFSSFSSIIYAENVLGITGGTLILVQTVPLLFTLAAIPVVSRLSSKYGKKRIMAFGLVAQIIMSFIQYPMNEDTKYVYIVLVLVGSVISPCVIVIPYSCLTDVIDIDEAEHGVRRDGSFFSLWNFLGKILGSLAVTVSAYMLDHAGYISDDSASSASGDIIQNDDVLHILTLLQTIIPACSLSFGLVFLYYYSIDRESHAKALADLEIQRKNAQGAVRVLSS